MSNQSHTPSNESHRHRLSGWKEIAAYFDRSVRTMQRWEKEFGLPVHRLGQGRSESVHSYVEDLDRWQTTAEAEDARLASPRGADDDGAQADLNENSGSIVRVRRAGIWRWGIAAVGIVAVLLFAGTQLKRVFAPAPEPATWKIAGETLSVFGENGATLWAHRFPFTLSDETSKGLTSTHGWRARIIDIDEDGRREVLVVTVPTERRTSDFRFYCFNSTGSLRWSQSGVPAQSFGTRTFDPTFAADQFFLASGSGGAPLLFLSYVHIPWFPSVVYRVGPDGARLSEFWSSGYTTSVHTAEWSGRRITLVGSRNNESRGAGLALLEGWTPSGSAPAADPAYQCRTCPAGRPTYFVELPRPASFDPLGASSPVVRIEAGSEEPISVWVDHLKEFDGERLQSGEQYVIYTLDSQLRPLSVDVGDGFAVRKDEAAAHSRITLPPVPALIEELRTIRWWAGSKFIDLKAPARRPGG